MKSKFGVSLLAAALLCLGISAANAQEAKPETAPTATPALTILLANDGSQGGVPYNNLIQASDGNLYGTNQCAGYSECITASGLGPSSLGNIFKITPAGVYSVIHTFAQDDNGSIPQGLVEAPDGNFYGTTVWAGADNCGTIFSFNPKTSILSTLYTFTGGADSCNPLGIVVYGDDGYLYGSNVQFAGTNSDGGSVWRILPDGEGFQTLWEFNVDGGDNVTAFGVNPQDGVVKVGGSLYGTSQNGGTDGYGALWQITPSSTTSTGAVLHTFTGGADSGYPAFAPREYSDGYLYGGTLQGDGTIYKAGTTSGFTTVYDPGAVYAFQGRPEFDSAGDLLFGTAATAGAFPGGNLYSYLPSANTGASLYTFPSSMTEGLQPDTAFVDNTGHIWTEQYDDGSDANPGSIVEFTVSPAISPSISITAGATTLAPGKSTTISWSTNDAFSSNEQVCFATQTPSTGANWSGLQTGTYTSGVLSGSKSVAFTTAAVYTLAITCGGRQSALTTVNVTSGPVATTTMLTASPNPVASGKNVTLTATVKKSSGTGTPTGKVAFVTGTTTLATVTLNKEGVAVLTASTTGYPKGTYPIKAMYQGDANDNASTSSAVNVVVATATTTALTASPNPVPHGGTVTLTATVTPTATGNVTFKTGTTVLDTVALSGGKAVLKAPTSSYPAGTYPIVATYAGNSSDAGSTSNTVNVKLQ